MGEKKKKKKVLLSGSDPFYLSKKLRRRRYGEVSAQTSQKSQNRALKKKKSCVPCACGASMYPTTWTINRTFSKSEILAESLVYNPTKKKKFKKPNSGKNPKSKLIPCRGCFRLGIFGAQLDARRKRLIQRLDPPTLERSHHTRASFHPQITALF